MITNHDPGTFVAAAFASGAPRSWALRQLRPRERAVFRGLKCTAFHLNYKQFESLIRFRFCHLCGLNLGLRGDPNPSKECSLTKAGANNGNIVGPDPSLTRNVFLHVSLRVGIGHAGTAGKGSKSCKTSSLRLRLPLCSHHSGFHLKVNSMAFPVWSLQLFLQSSVAKRFTCQANRNHTGPSQCCTCPSASRAAAEVLVLAPPSHSRPRTCCPAGISGVRPCIPHYYLACRRSTAQRIHNGCQPRSSLLGYLQSTPLAT